MKFGDLSKEIEEGLQKVYEKNLKIVSCLNDFQEIVIKNYKMPLTITVNDKLMAYQKILLNTEYVENVLLDKKSYEAICLKIFRLLFLGPEIVNYDNLDEKIHAFKMILNKLENKLDWEIEKNYINDIIKSKQKQDWRKLLKLPLIDNGGLSLLIN